MNRARWAVAVLLTALVLAQLGGCGCDGGGGTTGFPPAHLANTWVKTSRVVNNVAEVPIRVPMTYTFDTNGTYTGTDGNAQNPYNEEGTWALLVNTLTIHRASNNAGRPVENLIADINLVDDLHFTLSYRSSIGNGQYIDILETFTMQ